KEVKEMPSTLYPKPEGRNPKKWDKKKGKK
mgnify:CR=1